MKKLIFACLMAWSAVAMATAGIVPQPKKVKATVHKEQCCARGKSDPNCCPSSCCK